MHVYDMFCKGKLSDNKWHGQRFELYECFLVFHIILLYKNYF